MDTERAQDVQAGPAVTAVTQELVENYQKKRAALFDELRAKPSGKSWCQKYTALADEIVKSLFERVGAKDLAVIAVGGYGRGELAPGSDIDITFVPQDENDRATETDVRELFKLLTETFRGLEWPVGYAYRLPSDCPALDDKTRTGLLDARLVAGSQEAFSSLQEFFSDTFPIPDFLIAKFRERKDMHAKWHDIPRVAEFHLREGAGGLRDYQTAKWLDKVLPGEIPALDGDDAYDLLLTVRNVLHLVTERKEDRLLRTRRANVAEIMSVQSDDLAGMVMQAGESIAQIWESTKNSAPRAHFALAPGVVASNGRALCAGATLADAAVGVCKATELDLQIEKMEPAADVGDVRLFIDCATSGEKALRGLEKAGLLAKFIPEFDKCKYLLSKDSVHTYSVAEHTLRVISNLDTLRSVQEYEQIWNEAPNARPLYMAALLHDLGKANPEVSHSEAGAQIAHDVCRRLGVSAPEEETITWLIREHLTLAHMARTFDLAQPKTAATLAKICERPDRLAMLYLLTIADTTAVADGMWTPQMSSDARELYDRTRVALGAEEWPDDPAVYRSEAVRRLKNQPKAVEELLSSMPTHYLLATPLELLPLHADYLGRAKAGEKIVVFQNQPDTGTTEITICTEDLPKPGLLSRLLGVAYAFDLTLHSVRAASTTGPNPIALDVLTVSFRKQPIPPSLSRFVAAEMKKCIDSEEALDVLLLKHGKDPNQKQAMLNYRFFEGELGILEIETPLGRGMPYRVSKMLAGLGWNVHVARIGQWASRAVARFYLELPGGQLTRQVVEANFGPGA